MIDKILLGFNLKSVISLIATIFAYLCGGSETAFVVLLIVTFIDGLTGVYKAYSNNAILSTRFRDKAKHYIAYCLVIVSMNQVMIIAPYLQFLVEFVVLYFAAGELISIMENLEEAGIPMPTYIKKKLLNIRNKK